MIRTIYPKNGDRLHVMTDIQKKFVELHRSGKLTEESVNFIKKDSSAPCVSVFRWTTDEEEPAVLEISDNADELLNRYSQTHLNVEGPYQDTDGTFFSLVSNFCTGTRYYWRIRCGDTVSDTCFIDTEMDPIRTILVDNVPNFRDLGGKTAKDGKYVKQGKIYRGTYIENTYNDGFGLSHRGKNTFCRELGIKTEIDLREEAEGRFSSSPAGEDVRYVFVGFDSAFGGTFNDRGMDQLKKILNPFFSEESYPVYFHCYSGADRTGFLGIVLDGLLGLSDDEIKLDYNFTSLFEYRNWDESSSIRDYFGFLMEKYGQHSLSDLVLLHLTDYGISPEKIEAFRKIMLG